MGRAQKIKELEARKAKLAEMLAAMKAEERLAHAKAERKRDTRRKILLGAMLLARIQNGQLQEAEVRAWLGGFLLKPEEQALFPPDLPL